MLAIGYTPQEAVAILVRRVRRYEANGLTHVVAVERAATFAVAVHKVADLVPPPVAVEG